MSLSSYFDKGSDEYCAENYKLAFVTYTEGISKGHFDCALGLGRHHFTGFGVAKRDKLLAKYYFDQAEDANVVETLTTTATPKAMYFLAFIYQNGICGVETNVKEATICYETAVAQGHVPSMNNFAVNLYNGLGCEKDPDRAFELYSKAAELGHRTAMHNLGANYSRSGPKQDLKKGHSWYVKSAEKGDLDAMHRVGFNYRRGRGVKKDINIAVEWFKKSVDLGHAPSMNTLGVLYETGEEIEKDEVLALEYYKKASDLGYMYSSFNVGLCLLDGKGCEVNAEEANVFLQKAIDEGHVRACLSLGLNYERGTGVQKDPVKANELYALAAERGSGEGYFNLAANFETGLGCELSCDLAIDNYLKGVALEYGECAFNLGVMYRDGSGVEQDQLLSMCYFRIASEMGWEIGSSGIGDFFFNSTPYVARNYLRSAYLYTSSSSGSANSWDEIQLRSVVFDDVRLGVRHRVQKEKEQRAAKEEQEE